MLLAVFDGHGGSVASDFCMDRTPRYWEHSRGLSPARRLKRLVQTLITQTSKYHHGTTASIVYITKNKAYSAVIGDSPLLLRTNQAEYWVAPEHNVRTNLVERTLAEDRGGVYYNGYVWNGTPGGDYAEGLQMSRALGDAQMGKIIDHHAEYFVSALDDYSWVLVTSDGVMDPGHEKTASIIKDIQAKLDKVTNLTADDIVSEAVKVRHTSDNATAILYRARV